MTTEGIDIVILFNGIGIGMLLLGISVKTGKYKSWWLMKSTPIVPMPAAHMGIPVSIGFFVIAIAALFADLATRQAIFFFGSFLLFIACILALWRPCWLTPKWLLWLEDNYSEAFLELLRKEAQQMGALEWQARVRTQANLEAWAAEVRWKYGR